MKIYVNHNCLRAARTGTSATDLKHNFIFSTEMALTTKRPDIAIWSVKVKKKVFVIELTVPYEENFDWAHQRKLEKI